MRLSSPEEHVGKGWQRIDFHSSQSWVCIWKLFDLKEHLWLKGENVANTHILNIAHLLGILKTQTPRGFFCCLWNTLHRPGAQTYFPTNNFHLYIIEPGCWPEAFLADGTKQECWCVYFGSHWGVLSGVLANLIFTGLLLLKTETKLLVSENYGVMCGQESGIMLLTSNLSLSLWQEKN